MKHITEQTIQEILSAVEEQNDAPFEYLMNVLKQEQSSLYEYLFEAEERGLTETERLVLLHSAVMGWYIVREAAATGTILDTEFLYSQLEINIDLLEEIDGELGDFDEALFTLVDESIQPVLLGFLMDYIVDQQDECEGSVRDEVIPVLVLHCKTVIESLL